MKIDIIIILVIILLSSFLIFSKHRNKSQNNDVNIKNKKILRKVSQSELKDLPYLTWNAFIDLIAVENYDDLTEKQRIAHLAFFYDGEVYNGGHYQYFENKGVEYLKETLAALKKIGAERQYEILNSASQKYIKLNPKKAETIEEFDAGVLEMNYKKFDNDYYDCDPDMNRYLEEYLENNIDEFIEFDK